MTASATFRLLRVAEADFPSRFGKFRIFGYEGHYTTGVDECVVLCMGNITSGAPLVRVHSQCLTGDVFHSLRCDCRSQLEFALAKIGQAGAGVLIYEQKEGRGIGIMNKLRAYELQDRGADTVEANEQLGFEADLRDYELPGAILHDLGVQRVRLMSNNPKKIEAIEKAGVEVVERVPVEVEILPTYEEYLRTKREKMGHLPWGDPPLERSE